MWKEIPNTNGLYFANENGEIKSADRERTYISHGKKGKYLRKGKILSQPLNSNGYPCVTIKYINGNQKVIPVHRLIAMTFIANEDNKPQINHIDGNKLNNNISNLEWCTAKENIIHAFLHGLNKGTCPMQNKTGRLHPRSIPVSVYDKENNFIAEYESINLASKDLKVNCSHISDCINGKRKTAGGYIWKINYPSYP